MTADNLTSEKRPADGIFFAGEQRDPSIKKGKIDENGEFHGGKSFIGLGVSKDFGATGDGEHHQSSIYNGTVAEKFHCVGDGGEAEYCYWKIVFEDGDTEDFNIEELREGAALFRELHGGRIVSDAITNFFEFIANRQERWRRWKEARACSTASRNSGRSSPEDSKDGGNLVHDKIFRDFSFCNVYRELDRGTAFFRSHVLDLWKNFCQLHPDIEVRGAHHLVDWIHIVLWKSFVYRQVNKIETFLDFSEIPGPNKWPEFKRFARKAQKKGGWGGDLSVSFFTDAHINQGFDNFIKYTDMLLAAYNSEHQTEISKKDKSNSNVNDCWEVGSKFSLLDATSQEITHNAASGDLEACFRAIKKLNGIGNFMAWQILCDLMESNCLSGCGCESFCMLGPGAVVGLEKVFFPLQGPKYSCSIARVDLCKLLVKMQDRVYGSTGDTGKMLPFARWRDRPLSMKEIEHALCDYQKFLAIESQVLNGKPHVGQRKRKSRCYLDKGIDLQGTGSAVYCDTCNNLISCENAGNKFAGGADVCKRCLELERFDWKIKAKFGPNGV